MIKIGIIGLGTVGTSVVKILQEHKSLIKARAGKEIVVTKGVARTLSKHSDLNIKLSDDINSVINDPEIDIVVELIGGVELAKTVVEKSLKNNKHVVTANKALLAYHRNYLSSLATKSVLAYEASVAGGIPIIKALRDGLSANHIESIKGIINGTCNYMLTKMTKQGVAFDDVLKEAQKLGYAEADPSFDIGGFDASHKLLILASIAYGINALPEDILIEGIENISKEDVEFANEFGYIIKHLGIAKRHKNKVSLRVHPCLIPQDEMIAKVDGVLNGISVVGDKVGETLYYGAGAGGDATASAVIADIIEIARGNQNTPTLGYKVPLEQHHLSLLNKNDIESEYYIRLLAQDKMGVLAQITSIFAQNKISVASLLQKQDQEGAHILLSTHKAKEKDLQSSLSQIKNLEAIKKEPRMIRIEK